MRIARLAIICLGLLPLQLGTARAQPVLIDQFDPGLGSLVSLGFDFSTDLVWVYPGFGTVLSSYTRAGVFVDAIPRPGEAADDFDLDVTTEALTLNGTSVPAGSLLVINGETGPADVYALDKSDGTLLASLTTAFGSNHVVGGAWHVQRDTLFLVADKNDATTPSRIAEIDPATGAVLNDFSPGVDFTVNFGDLAVSPVTGNLFLVSSDETFIRQLTPTGVLVGDIPYPGGVGSISGLGIDETRAQALLSSTSSDVFIIGPGATTTTTTTTSTTLTTLESTTTSTTAPSSSTTSTTTPSSSTTSTTTPTSSTTSTTTPGSSTTSTTTPGGSTTTTSTPGSSTTSTTVVGSTTSSTLASTTSTSTVTTVTSTSSTTNTTVPPATCELLTGKKLLLKAKAGSAKRGIGLLSGDTSLTLGAGNGSADDPVLNGGSVRIVATGGDAFDDTYPLPADRWSYKKKEGQNLGYKFRPTSPIKSVTVQPGKRLKIVANGTGLGHTLQSQPDSVDVVVTLGAHCYCLNFGGSITFKADKKFLAKDSRAPVVCVAPAGVTAAHGTARR